MLAAALVALSALVAAGPIGAAAEPSEQASAAAKKCKKKKGAKKKKKKCKKPAPANPTTPSPATPSTPPPGPPGIEVTPASVNFGPMPVGVSTGNFPLTIRNTGGTTLTPVEVDLTGSQRFSLVNEDCGTLAPGAACFANIEFTAMGIGDPQAATLTASAPGVSDSSSLAGSGSGGTATLSMTPDPLDFGPVAINNFSAIQSFTVTNTGNATSGVLLFGDAGGGNPLDFIQLPELSNCFGEANPTARLLPLQSCTFPMRFRPLPGPVGGRSALWAVDEDPGPATDTATMNGIAQ
jgi:hypothetical protein